MGDEKSCLLTDAAYKIFEKWFDSTATRDKRETEEYEPSWEEQILLYKEIQSRLNDGCEPEDMLPKPEMQLRERPERGRAVDFLKKLIKEHLDRG